LAIDDPDWGLASRLVTLSLSWLAREASIGSVGSLHQTLEFWLKKSLAAGLYIMKTLPKWGFYVSVALGKKGE